MARFDDQLIERLKTETDIAALIESYGTKLHDRNRGGEMIGLCPIHDDRNPSLVVNRKKNVWNCLGACGQGGDVIQWVMHAEKVSFRHAVELLQEGNVGKLQSGKTKAGYSRRLESPIQAGVEDQKLLAQVADYYHSRLKETPKALEYLEKRGIANGDAIERFKIGFSDRSFGLRLPKKETQSGMEIRERLERLGVFRAGTGHEAMRGCVTFPVAIEGGGVGEIYGRRIASPSRGASVHWYLDGPHVGVWNEAAFTASDEIILCESIIDALTFWCAGYRNVTCSYGTGGLTEEIYGAFIRHDIKRVLIAYDRDKAGDKATEQLAERLMRDNFEAFRITVNAASKDVNGFARASAKAGPENVRNMLGLLIRNAAWLGKGKAPELWTIVPDFLSDTGKQVTADDATDAEQTIAQPEESSGEAAKEKNNAPNVEPEPAKPVSLLAAVGRSDEVASDTAADPPKESPVVSPVPAAPKEIEAKIGEREITLQIGNRVYRVRGLEKNLAFDVLKVNILARRDERLHVDTLDLYASRARSLFVKEASRELEFDPSVIKRDLGKVLLKLETLQDEQIETALAVKNEKPELTDAEKQAALDLLRQPNLIERILSDFAAIGVVGEETNKLVGYLSATSRLLEKPLAVVIQSSSAAGKSSLMDAVLKFIPGEEQVGYSAMTGQSLFYMGSMELQHKILSIAEEEGVAQASYALKLLQSEGELTIASTGKDPGTGRMETQEYHVEGPVMIFLTTTAIDIDEELLNRCVVLTVDENREQTRAIHNQQRKNETLDGLLSSKRSSAVRKLHQDAQRQLRPLHVVNPFADSLEFCDDQARRRRDHMKYLTLIRSITLLHQYQREIKSETVGEETVQYIEVTIGDIALANRLADQVLGKSIDELPPQTRRLLLELHGWVCGECERLKLQQRELRFTRRMIRESLGWSQTALKKHIDRLQEMEFLLPYRGSGRRVEYELLYDGRGREGQPTMCGLIDPNHLAGAAAKAVTTTNKSSPSKKSSSPLAPASSPLAASSSPQDHAQITPSSTQVMNGKPVKTKVKPRPR